MKIPIFVIATLFLAFCNTNVFAQRRLEKIYDAMECPPRSSGTYRKVCAHLQDYYVKSPDRKLNSYLKSGIQEAGNRIMRTVSQSDKVTVGIVKGCMLNFQVTINKLNEEAVRKIRSCKNKCFVEAGQQFVRSLDNDAVERARCIMGSI